MPPRIAAWLLAGSITAALALGADGGSRRPAVRPAAPFAAPASGAAVTIVPIGMHLEPDAEERAVQGPHPTPGPLANAALKPLVQRSDYHIAASRGLESGGRLVASWYGSECQGLQTANGERFDRVALTAAHRSLPFGTVLVVTNLRNGKSVQVRINDRGPWVAGRDIDLSEAAFAAIAPLGAGVIPVRVQVVGR